MAETSKRSSTRGSTNRRLGRGLASLMASTVSAEQDQAQQEDTTEATPASPSRGTYRPSQRSRRADTSTAEANLPETMIPLDHIRPNPHQPRKQFTEQVLHELAESIRQQGVLQPLLVAHDNTSGDHQYILIAGERRLRAAGLAGLEQVPCIIREATREQMIEWALIENVQRSDLNPLEQATAYRDYIDRFSATQQQLAEKLGTPRSTIANYLRILDLSDTAQDLVAQGQLSLGHAKVLAGLAHRPEAQESLARRVSENGLSVRHLEQLVAAVVNGASEPQAPRQAPAKQKSQYILDVERQLAQVTGTKVTIRPGRKKNAGRIVIDYYSLDDFDRIVESLGAHIDS